MRATNNVSDVAKLDTTPRTVGLRWELCRTLTKIKVQLLLQLVQTTMANSRPNRALRCPKLRLPLCIEFHKFHAILAITVLQMNYNLWFLICGRIPFHLAVPSQYVFCSSFSLVMTLSMHVFWWYGFGWESFRFRWWRAEKHRDDRYERCWGRLISSSVHQPFLWFWTPYGKRLGCQCKWAELGACNWCEDSHWIAEQINGDQRLHEGHLLRWGFGWASRSGL